MIDCTFLRFFFFLFFLADESYLSNGYLDIVIDWIPGMRDIRLKDLPSFVRTTDPNDIIFNFVSESVERAPKASGIVVHTFNALEQEVLDALSTMFPRVYAIGPLASNHYLITYPMTLWNQLGIVYGRKKVSALIGLTLRHPTQ